MLTEKEQEEVAKYGMTKLERDYIQFQNAADNYWHTPYGVYVRHRNNAKQNGIEWRLTFADWWKAWEDSGKWNQRGRGKDDYCMARKMDSGAYEPGNIQIVPKAYNSSKKVENEKEHYGCSRKELDRIQRAWKADDYNHSPYGIFLQQKKNAESRDIEWNLTFYNWWEIWELSGKWSKRGKGLGKYCMARLFDTGPYEEGNVHIIPSEENNRQWACAMSSGIRTGDTRGSAMTEEDRKFIADLEARLP